MARSAAEPEMEGRLNAQREAISLLFALVADCNGRRDEVLRLLQSRATLSDHQEDPGAVLEEEFASQVVRARELATIAEDVEALLSAPGRARGP